MKNVKSAIPLLLALASCTASPTQFKHMSKAELIVYNRSVEYLDQVYCSRQTVTFSRIPRHSCITFREMEEGRIGSLDTPSSSTSYSR
ncbi:MAG: hypothetical protein ACJA1Q_002978 [Pseudohongiellaceae bacterium]|jgi:hypothetical protein